MGFGTQKYKADPRRKPAPKKNFTTKAIDGYRDYNRSQNAQALAGDVAGWSQAAVASRMAPGGQGGYMSSGGGGGGGGRGGGGGSFNDDPYKEYRAQLEAKLNELKAAIPGALDGYLSNYTGKINQIFSQNAALTGQYGADIRGILARVLAEAGNARDGLQTDLMAQGADTRALGAQYQANALGAQQMSGAGEMYNQRLAQLQAMAHADRQGMGAAIDQSARGQMENSYMQALAQIQALR